MAGHTFVSNGVAAVAGTVVDILGDANFTAKQLLIANGDGALFISVSGLGTVNPMMVGPKEVVVLTGTFRSLVLSEATSSAMFRVVASDSTLPAMSITNIS